MERYSTFSVGIFQWLTKASGKGLKQSAGICRVLGYTAEPERVYQKALEICARLNREGASAATPPKWLQKQYSVPRPPGMVRRRTSNEFTAAQVRALRLKVMKEYLLAAGFVLGKESTYVRRQDDQIHLVNFQGSKYGHEFTVNLGFHYTFIPPLLRQRVLPLADFHLLDCIAQARIGYFLPKKRDTWFKYGHDREQLLADLRLCATTCLTVFSRYSARWQVPSALLNDLTTNRRSPWRNGKEIALGWIELKSGQVEAAEARLAKWSDDHYQKRRPLCVWLKRLIAAQRKAGARTTAKRNWKCWVE